MFCFGNGGFPAICALPFGSAESLEEGDGDKATSIGEGWIASFVPFRIILPSNDMEKVSP